MNRNSEPKYPEESYLPTASTLPSVDDVFLVLVLILIVVLVVVVGRPADDGVDDVVVIRATGAPAWLRTRRRRDGGRGRGGRRRRRGRRGRHRDRGQIRRRGWHRGCGSAGGGICRGSDSGQSVRVGGVMSQARRRGCDGGRRCARGGHACGVMIMRTLIILLMMMIRHVHRPGGVRAGVHAVVMMVSGRRRVRVRMMGRAEVGVALVQLFVHLHLGWLGILGAGWGTSGISRQ